VTQKVLQREELIRMGFVEADGESRAQRVSVGAGGSARLWGPRVRDFPQAGSESLRMAAGASGPNNEGSN